MFHVLIIYFKIFDVGELIIYQGNIYSTELELRIFNRLEEYSAINKYKINLDLVHSS